MKNQLECAVIPSLSLVIGQKLYTVTFPLSAVAKAENVTGKSLKSLPDWFNLETKDIPAVLEAGLYMHHPDIDAADICAICDQLNPESLDEVLYALCSLAFPRRMKAYEEHREKWAQGKVSPNVPSGATL